MRKKKGGISFPPLTMIKSHGLVQSQEWLLFIIQVLIIIPFEWVPKNSSFSQQILWIW